MCYLINNFSLGILSQRWGILLNRIRLQPDNVNTLVATTCALHNYLRYETDGQYLPPGFADAIDGHSDGTAGQWRLNQEELQQSQPTAAHRSTTVAIQQRQIYSEYFVGAGNVQFQWENVNSRVSARRRRH